MRVSRICLAAAVALAFGLANPKPAKADHVHIGIGYRGIHFDYYGDRYHYYPRSHRYQYYPYYRSRYDYYPRRYYYRERSDPPRLNRYDLRATSRYYSPRRGRPSPGRVTPLGGW